MSRWFWSSVSLAVMLFARRTVKCLWCVIACEQALLFGQTNRASRERLSLAQTGELARRLGALRSVLFVTVEPPIYCKSHSLLSSHSVVVSFSFTMRSRARAHPHKWPAPVTTTFWNFRGGRLRETWLLLKSRQFSVNNFHLWSSALFPCMSCRAAIHCT